MQPTGMGVQQQQQQQRCGTYNKKNSTTPSRKQTITTTTTPSGSRQQQQQRQVNDNKTTKQHQKSTTTTKPKPATRKRNQTIERSQNQPDIKLFLAKKSLEIEARAAAIVQPTQVRINFTQPSIDVTSARSEPDDDPGGNQ